MEIIFWENQKSQSRKWNATSEEHKEKIAEKNALLKYQSHK